MPQSSARPRGALRLTLVTFAYDRSVEDPDALLDRYVTLTGWAEAATRAGAQVTVVQGFSTDARRDLRGVEYRFVPIRGRLGGARRLADVVGGTTPDVVHVNGLDDPLRLCGLGLGLPVGVALVVQDHASRPPSARSVRWPLLRAAGRRVDGWLFTSLPQAEPWVHGARIPDRRAVFDVLEASTTMGPIDRRTAAEVSGIAGRPSLLWVGRLNALKDPLTVLDGFERALRTLPDATLTMVYGEDDLLGPVRARLAASPALSGRVRLAGAVPHAQLAAWYTAADLFVLGSWFEGSGYALLEACACGAAPVVTSIPAFRAIAGDGPAWFWDAGDAAGCAAAVADAAAADLPRVRAAVRERFVRHLSWDAVGERAHGIYEMVSARRRAVGRR